MEITVNKSYASVYEALDNLNYLYVGSAKDREVFKDSEGTFWALVGMDHIGKHINTITLEFYHN